MAWVARRTAGGCPRETPNAELLAVADGQLATHAILTYRAVDYFPSCGVSPSTCISKYSFLL